MVRDLTRNVEKIRASAGTLRRRNVDLQNDVCYKKVLTTIETARVIALTRELVSVKSKLDEDCLENESFCWSALSATKGTSKV